MTSRELALVVSVSVPLIVAGGKVFSGVLKGLSREAKDASTAATGQAAEAIACIRTVRAFAAEDHESERFAASAARARELSTRLQFGIGGLVGLGHLFTNGVVLSVLYFGGEIMARAPDRLDAGGLMSFLVSAQAAQRSVQQLSILMSSAMQGLDAGARVVELLRLQPSIALRGGVTALPHADGAVGVTFEDVHFHYPGREERAVLHGFNLELPPGQTVALCGPSGGGKSTVAALLERFYDADGGRVTVDGIDVRELDPSWLRSDVIGFIDQEPVLFAASVAENIRYGRPTATDAEVIQAARRANADGFIRELPEGYATVLGERGDTVSGGQRQRIAIARALLKDPRILILDEATSALDAESERLVQDALAELTRDRTTLVIAHRLSTIQSADAIAVLSRGDVVELGTHAELLAAEGAYASLIANQEMESSAPAGGLVARVFRALRGQ